MRLLALFTLALLAGCAVSKDHDPGAEIPEPEGHPSPDVGDPTPTPAPIPEANTLWWLRAGGTGYDDSYSIAADEGDLIIAGSFRETADYGGGSVIVTGWEDAFVARYSSDGVLLWFRHFGAEGALSRAVGVAVGPDGIAATGTFRTAIDFGDGPVTPAGKDDVFVVMLDPATGETRWSATLGEAEWDHAGDVAFAPDGDVVVTGEIASKLLLARFDASGVLQWSKLTGYVFGNASNWPAVSDLDVDAAGTAYVIGSFSGQAQLGGTPLTSAGGDDIFLGAFDANGDHVWSRRFGGPIAPMVGGDEGSSLAVLGDTLFISGGVFGNVDLGGGPLPGNPGYWNAFAARLSSADGSHIWSRSLGNSWAGPLILDGDDVVVLSSSFGSQPSPVLKRLSPVDGSLLIEARVPLYGSIAAAGTGRIALTGTFWYPLSVEGETVESGGSSDVFLEVLLDPWTAIAAGGQP